MISQRFSRFSRLFVFTWAAVLLVAVGGTADAQKVRLRSKITPTCSSGSSIWKFADIYGDGNIAVQGSYNCRGAFIYNISNPDAPTLASWYNPGSNQQFLEAIVIGNRGYFGSGNGGGVHIVDLTNPATPVLLGVVNSANGNGFNSIHEMVVFSQNGAQYLIENFNGFSNKLLKVINVTNPAAPVFIRDIAPTEVSWVHAMHIRGSRMFTSGWGTSSVRGRTEIYDISNIGMQAPSLLGFVEDSSASITAGNNMHSSWTSEDGQYLYSAREVTNSNGASPGDVRVYDISNPGQPVLMNRVTMNNLNLNAVTPHNPVVMGSKLYVSWYQAGLQLFDISTATNMNWIGQYDTYQATFAPEESEVELAGEPWDIVCGTNSFQNALPTTYNGNWAVYPFLGEDKVLVGDMTGGLLIVDVTQANAPAKNVVSDFDGDRKTDVSVYSPATGTWVVEKSSDGSLVTTEWGIPGDIIVPGDYDGDQETDYAAWRPSTGMWWIVGSAGTNMASQFGASGDVPVPADYDADGRTDMAVWRPSTGVWYIFQSTLGVRIVQFGMNGDKVFSGDFEGDGKADLAVWRPSTGVWYILQSSSTIAMIAPFGQSGDKPLLGDFDGDGKSDLTIYRPSSGLWYIFNSRDNTLSGYQFGAADDIPVPSDFDGDGRADVAVYRPSSNTWYKISSSVGSVSVRTLGQAGDVPAPSSVQPN